MKDKATELYKQVVKRIKLTNWEKVWKDIKPHLAIIGIAVTIFFIGTVNGWCLRSANANNWDRIRCEIQEVK